MNEAQVKPITPDEIVDRKREVIPDFVFEAFNYCIVEEWDGRSATVGQDEVIDYIMSLIEKEGIKDVERQDLFDKHWLDIEDIYREAGWDVYYDKPAYNETYEATFKFSKKGKK